MLFLGTDRYPVEGEYREFLSQHNGRSNAWTGAESTNYHFDVHYEFLDGALDRFSQFYVAPLFSESATNREKRSCKMIRGCTIQL